MARPAPSGAAGSTPDRPPAPPRNGPRAAGRARPRGSPALPGGRRCSASARPGWPTRSRGGPDRRTGGTTRPERAGDAPPVPSYQRRALLQRAGEADQPGHPLRAVGRGTHPYREVVAHQGPGVAMVGLTLGVATAGLLQVDPPDGAPPHGQPGLVDVLR